MKIRNKIILYFTTTVITLSAVSLIIIYFLFAAYREEAFQQLQKEKIKFTVKQISKYKEMSENLAHIMDELTIHDFYDEKMMVFDIHKKKIFSSIDDLTISKKEELLKNLSEKKAWIETKEGDYDLIGIYIKEKDKEYYAISKAYDAVGYSKMYFLKTVLIGIFIFISIVVFLVSQYISNKISKPLTSLSEKINDFDLASETITELKNENSSYELELLTNRFNDLIKRTNKTFAFQKHTIDHISHQFRDSGPDVSAGILATPERFYGKPIYTTGYLQLGPGGSAGLAPSPATFEANDTIGCIQVERYSID